MSKRNQSLLEFMDLTPPALVRIMAVNAGKGRKPQLKPLREIIEASGLDRRRLQRLIWRKTWKDVKIGVAAKFIEGCGVDILHTQLDSGKVKNGKMTRYYFFKNYIEKGLPHLSKYQRERFYKLMEWEKSEL